MDYKQLQYLKNCIKPLLPVCLDGCFTEAEQIGKLTCAVNQLISNDSYFKSNLDQFFSEFDSNLNTVVRNILNEWKNNGTIGDIFSDIFANNVFTKSNSQLSDRSGIILSFNPLDRSGMLYKTYNGKDFVKIANIPDQKFGNSALFYKDGWWYCGIFSNAATENPNSLVFLVSQNLIDWRQTTYTLPSITQPAAFSNPGNFFEWQNKLYYCFYYVDATKTPGSGGNGYTNYIVEITSINGGTMAFSTPAAISLPDEPYFDPFIFSVSDTLYLLTKLDNATGGIYYTTLTGVNTPGALTRLTGFDIAGVGQCEAPSAFYSEQDGNFYVYADDYRSGFVKAPYGGMVVSYGPSLSNLSAPTPINSYSIPMRAGLFYRLSPIDSSAIQVSYLPEIGNTPRNFLLSDGYWEDGLLLNQGEDNTYIFNNNYTLSTIYDSGCKSFSITLPPNNHLIIEPSDMIDTPDSLTLCYPNRAYSNTTISFKKFAGKWEVSPMPTNVISINMTTNKTCLLHLKGDTSSPLAIAVNYITNTLTDNRYGTAICYIQGNSIAVYNPQGSPPVTFSVADNTLSILTAYNYTHIDIHLPAMIWGWWELTE